jgi:hypothetical protein
MARLISRPSWSQNFRNIMQNATEQAKVDFPQNPKRELYRAAALHRQRLPDKIRDIHRLALDFDALQQVENRTNCPRVGAVIRALLALRRIGTEHPTAEKWKPLAKWLYHRRRLVGMLYGHLRHMHPLVRTDVERTILAAIVDPTKPSQTMLKKRLRQVSQELGGLVYERYVVEMYANSFLPYLDPVERMEADV